MNRFLEATVHTSMHPKSITAPKLHPADTLSWIVLGVSEDAI